MKKIIVSILTVVILLAAVYVVFAYTRDPNIPSQFEEGVYGQEIVFHYSDGTSDSLKSTSESRIWPFALYSDGKRITSIQYFLKAKFIGDYNQVDVNMLDYVVTFSTKLSDGSGMEYLRIVNKDLFNPPSLAFKSGIYQKTDSYITLCAFSEVPGNLIYDDAPNGIYTIKITPGGKITYRVDGGESVAATLPTSISFTVTKAPGTLTILWDQPYSVHTSG